MAGSPSKAGNRKINTSSSLSDVKDIESATPLLAGNSSGEIAKDKLNILTNSGSYFVPLLSCTMYTFCSVSMVLANKLISTSLPEEGRKSLPQISVILFQCVVAVLLAEGAKFLKIIDYAPFNLAVARQWLPLNLIFIGMLCSGFLALTYVSVPMVTVTKNCANLITVFGDAFIFKEYTPPLTVISVLLMTLAAIMASFNDLEFNAMGYIWLVVNCLCTSSYVLYMRFASTNIKLTKWGMIYYNNLLSACILLPVCFLNGELPGAFSNSAVMNWDYFFINFVAAFLGFYLNFASLWCVGSTSATTYAIVGSLNKVPITVLGFLLFDAKMTDNGIIFLTLATLAGFLYAYSKLPTNK